MRWFWANARPRGLYGEVRDALESRFHLDASFLDRLRLLEQAGEYRGRPVRYFKVLDPGMLGGGSAARVRKYEDLARGDRAFLFEGHIEKDGSVYLADRRPPKVLTRDQTA